MLEKMPISPMDNHMLHAPVLFTVSVIYVFTLQKCLFKDLGQGVLDNAWQGYNAALFAYGQTGSGKSYSMIGYGPNKGIVPITCEELFKVIESNKDDKKQLRVSVLIKGARLLATILQTILTLHVIF